MARSNRPRGRGAARPDDNQVDLSRAVLGFRKTESRSDGLWNVQPLPAVGGMKSYTCPGCSLEISPGVAHTVTWRADGIMGEEHDLAARRHWHQHCWRTKR